MARIDLPSITVWITAAACRHPHDLIGHLAERLAVSRATARRTVGRLVALGWLERSGTAQRPRHAPGRLRQVVGRYLLDGLQEHVPWRCDFAPFFELPPAVRRMAQHAFCELVNNAVDHSEGRQVTVSMRQTPLQLQLLVSDDGRGLFDKLQAAFALDDARTALFELSKGKLTSAPDRHCGHGLHFTSQLADVFQLHANAAAFQRRSWDAAAWHPSRALPRDGTSVYWSVALDTQRSLDAVLRSASLDGIGQGFERTQVALGMLASAEASLDSRSQARRVGDRLAGFKRAEVDFAGVPEVGHGFADELFRVFARQHPALDLVALNMTPSVTRLVEGLRPA